MKVAKQPQDLLFVVLSSWASDRNIVQPEIICGAKASGSGFNVLLTVYRSSWISMVAGKL